MEIEDLTVNFQALEVFNPNQVTGTEFTNINLYDEDALVWIPNEDPNADPNDGRYEVGDNFHHTTGDYSRNQTMNRQISVDCNEIFRQLLTYMETCFNARNGDPSKREVYDASCAFLNRQYPDITQESINKILKIIERKIKVACRAEIRIDQRIRALKQRLDNTFKTFVNDVRDDVMHMDVAALKQMQIALNSLTELVERQLAVWGFAHRSLVIAKMIFFRQEVQNGEFELSLQEIMD